MKLNIHQNLKWIGSIDLKNLSISVCENCMRNIWKSLNDYHRLLSVYLKDLLSELRRHELTLIRGQFKN